MNSHSEWPSFDFNFADGTSTINEGSLYTFVDAEDDAAVPNVPNTSVVNR